MTTREALEAEIDALRQQVAQLQQAQVGLRESEARYQRLVANAPGMFYQVVLEPHGTMWFPFVSDGCRNLFEVDPQAVEQDAQVLLQMIHPDDRPAFDDALAASLTGLQPWRWQGRFILPSGKVIWAQGASRPERLDNGAIRWDGFGIDITERKQLEQVLRESEQWFRQLMATLSDGLVLFDQGKIVDANPAMAQMVGYEVNELIGRSALEFVAAESQALVAQNMRSGYDRPYEALLVKKDGSVLPVEALGKMMIYQGRSVRLTSIRDISERKRAEAEFATLQARIIEAQQTALRELSTPLIPLNDTTIIMPLVGSLDSQRMQQVMEVLLEGIGAYQVDTAIIDITGVQMVDTQVANALIRTAQAVKLLGAQVVLTGISSTMAQTLIHLGTDLSGIITRSSLQSGIAYALRLPIASA